MACGVNDDAKFVEPVMFPCRLFDRGVQGGDWDDVPAKEVFVCDRSCQRDEAAPPPTEDGIVEFFRLGEMSGPCATEEVDKTIA